MYAFDNLTLRLLGRFIALASVFVPLCVAAVNFSAALYLSVGFALGIAGWLVVRLLFNACLTLWSHSLLLGFFLVLTLATLTRLEIYLYGPCGSFFIECLIEGPPTREHHIGIKPFRFAADQFLVDERLILTGDFGPQETLDERSIQFPSRFVSGERSGFFLHKLTVSGPAGRKVKITRADGSLAEYDICGYRCAAITIDISDFPAGAFYAAEIAQQPLIPTYPGPVSITWEFPTFYSGRPRDIVFWYHPSASPLLLAVLRPFVGIASLGSFILIIGGFVVSLLGAPFLLPPLQDIAKEWIKVRLTSRSSRRRKQRRR